MASYTLTGEAIRKVRKTVNRDKYQPPIEKSKKNRRPAQQPSAIQGPILSMDDGVATVNVVAADDPNLVGTVQSVIDLSGCIFDEEDEDLLEVWVWANWQHYIVDVVGQPKLTSSWVAFNRCCI